MKRFFFSNACLMALFFTALWTASCHEPTSDDEKIYVPCGENQFCEQITFEGQLCYLMPCGEDTCLVCPEPSDEKAEAVSTVTPETIVVSEVFQDAVIHITNYQAPEAAVTVHAVSQNPRIQLEPATITITPDNWEEVQPIQVSCQDDGAKNGVLNTNLSVSYTTEDQSYTQLGTQTVQVTCLDDGADLVDHVHVTKYGTMETDESGKSVKIGIRLDKQPEASVIVRAVSTDTTEGSVSPDSIVFVGQDYHQEQFFTVRGVDDNEIDGNQPYAIQLSVESKDAVYANTSLEEIALTNRDNEDAYGPGKYTIRFMAANITSGSKQSYDEGHGIRIFQALKPDIVLIQEFKYGNDTDADISKFVHETFGASYEYYRGTGSIPNGIISRYPIIDSGGWSSNVVSDRRWEWAVIDIPGSKNLLAVSLHLHTDDNAQEMTPLITKIKSKMNLDATEYYLVAGGDFNTKKRSNVAKKFEPTFSVSTTHYPVDQNGNGNTNARRANPYDWVLFSPDLDKLETDIVIGKHTYPDGHVFDSRVYGGVKGYKCSEHGGANELEDVTPVLGADSGSTNMQHMAVIRDVQIVVP